MTEPSWRQQTEKTSELNDVWAALFRLRDAVADLESKLTHLDKLDDDRGAQTSSESPRASAGAAKALAFTEAGSAAQAPQAAPRAETEYNVPTTPSSGERTSAAPSGTWAKCPSCGAIVNYDRWWQGKLCRRCFWARRA